MQCSAVISSIVQCSAVQCSAVKFSIVDSRVKTCGWAVLPRSAYHSIYFLAAPHGLSAAYPSAASAPPTAAAAAADSPTAAAANMSSFPT